MAPIVHLAALASAVASGTLLGGLGVLHRLPVLTRGGGLFLALALLEASLVTPGPRLSYLLAAAGGAVFVFLGPGFFHQVLGLSLSRSLDRLAAGVAGAYLTLVAVGLYPAESFPVVPAILVLFFGVIAWGWALAVYRWRTPGGVPALAARFLRRLVVVAAVSLPLVLADILASLLGWTWWAPVDNLALPVFLLVLSGTLAAELGAWVPALRQPPETLPPAEGTEAASEPDKDLLSPRERQIADRVWEGASAKEIGAELGLSPKTVENHTYRVYQKLGVRSRLQFYRSYR